jgi:hypothetical protein
MINLMWPLNSQAGMIFGCRELLLLIFPFMGLLFNVQGVAEISDDFAKQSCVEPLAWGICP